MVIYVLVYNYNAYPFILPHKWIGYIEYIVSYNSANFESVEFLSTMGTLYDMLILRKLCYFFQHFCNIVVLVHPKENKIMKLFSFLKVITHYALEAKNRIAKSVQPTYLHNT